MKWIMMKYKKDNKLINNIIYNNNGSVTDAVIGIALSFLLIASLATYFYIDSRLLQQNKTFLEIINEKEIFISDFYKGEKLYANDTSFSVVKSNDDNGVQILAKKENVDLPNGTNVKIDDFIDKYSIQIKLKGKNDIYDNFTLIRDVKGGVYL